MFIAIYHFFYIFIQEIFCILRFLFDFNEIF